MEPAANLLDVFLPINQLINWLLFFSQSRLRLLETELENDELAQYILDLFKAKDTFHTCAMWYFKLPGWSMCFPLLSEQSFGLLNFGENKGGVQPPHTRAD